MSARAIGLASGGLAVTLALTGTVLAQRGGAGVSRECRREIVSLCGFSGGRAGIRTCLGEKAASLSPSCRSEVLSVASRRAASTRALPAGARALSYGNAPLQNLDLWLPARAGKAPLVVFVHGGGWSIGDKRTGTGAKDAHFTGNGYAYASINYRLVPSVTPAEQADDVSAAIARLRREPGIDPDRIIVMGHSAGAHLAALVGTDESYLAKAGIPMSALRGIVLLDGAGYDVVAQMQSPGNPVQAMYDAAFTTDRKQQAALSPVTHVGAPDVSRWLIVNDADRPDAERQSALFAAALNRAGARAERLPVANTSHSALNLNVGKTGDPETARIDAFLTEVSR
jgi:arylformamidase